MRSRWFARVVCLLTLTALLVVLGCANALSERRNRYRLYSINRDLDHMISAVDWVLGLDEQSITYEDSFPPGPTL